MPDSPQITPEGIEEIRSRLKSTGAPQVAWDTFNAMVKIVTGASLPHLTIPRADSLPAAHRG